MSVDIESVINHLRKETENLDTVIDSLTALRSALHEARSAAAKQKRGRKFMGEDERKQVALRMKKYWAARRAEKGKSHAGIHSR